MISSQQVLDRYGRQELIEGWDQSKLKNADVAIVGADLLGQYTILPLAALGVGSLRIIGKETSRRERFLDFRLEGSSAKTIETVMEQVTPDVDVIGLQSPMVNKGSTLLLEDADVVIDTTNDPTSKAIVLDYCSSLDIPFFSLGSDRDYFGRLVRYDGTKHSRLIMPNLYSKQQGDITSMVLGGLITEEVKKTIMGEAQELTRPLYYNLTNSDRFSYERFSNPKRKSRREFANKTVLMIGAGALGNFVGMGLAKTSVARIDIIDDDDIEDTNLNRQILYYDSVGQNKAEVLASKLTEISTLNVKINPLVQRFEPDIILDTKYSLIFDCVDNFETRALLNDYAIEHKIPLISGATDIKGGWSCTYVPGKTGTIEDKMALHDEASAAVERRSATCILAPNPSVVMTNQVIGGLMIGESRTVFSPSVYGPPSDASLRYSTTSALRLDRGHLR